MFDIGAPEFLLLLVAAVILFGPEKLPEFARKAARLLRYIRTMAGSAQEQLSKELGPGFEDIDLRDLNPKTFLQKHLLDEVDPIVADVKKDFSDATAGGVGASKAVTDALNSAKDGSAGGPGHVLAGATPARPLTPFDPDAT
jgi:sec-independent protein translocase protein TatB